MGRLGTLAIALAAAAALAATLALGAATAVPATTASALPEKMATSRAVNAATGPRFPPPIAVTAIAFPGTGSAGWALGTEGSRTSIWHTGDDGGTWQVQWRGTGEPLALTATDTGHAWALLACATRGCGRRLIATTDSGTHWRQIATLPAKDGSVQFATAGLGVTTATRQCSPDLQAARCPARVLVSRDGGKHWTTALSSSGLAWATASATGQLWAAIALAGNASRLQFRTSKDGGRTWARLGTLTALAGWPFSDLTQATPQAGPAGLEAVSVFDQESCAMHGCAISAVFRTGDGGRSWHAATLPDKYPDQCGPARVALALAHDGTTWAAIERNAAACGPPFGELFRAGPAQPWRSLPPWQLTGAATLDAVSADVAWAIGGQGALSRTADGGQHWTQVLPAPSPSGELAALGARAAIGGQDATDSGAIVRLDGNRWRQVAELPGIVTWVGAAGEGVVYAASYAPGGATPWWLWTSGDGGSHWAPRGPLPGGASTVIEGPWLTADGHGMLLAVAGGTPWQSRAGGTGPASEWGTSDGGATWHRTGALAIGPAFLSGPVTFVYQPGSGWTGWVATLTVGGAGQVLAVTGNRAAALTGAPPADGLQLTGPGTGFAWSVDYSGAETTLTVYRTVDNGRHWSHAKFMLPGSEQPAPLIAFSDPGDGWLVAGQATLRTGDAGRSWAG